MKIRVGSKQRQTKQKNKIKCTNRVRNKIFHKGVGKKTKYTNRSDRNAQTRSEKYLQIGSENKKYANRWVRVKHKHKQGQ